MERNAVLEGNGHTITGLNIDDGKGVFGTAYAESVIRNLGFVNPTVANASSSRNTGVIAGDNLGDITNVYVTDGTVSGKAKVGILAGSHQKGTMSNVYATDTVTAEGKYALAGSLAGFATGPVQDSYSRTNVSAADGTYADGFALTVGKRTTVNNPRHTYEEENAAPTNRRLAQFSKTPRELKTGRFAEWDASVWDFGDDCQYPALKSGGHRPERQTARGGACFQ